MKPETRNPNLRPSASIYGCPARPSSLDIIPAHLIEHAQIDHTAALSLAVMADMLLEQDWEAIAHLADTLAERARRHIAAAEAHLRQSASICGFPPRL